MQRARHDFAPPRPILAAAGLMIALAIALAAWSRMQAANSESAPQPVAAERWLRFEDRADGGIEVVDAERETRVALVEPGSHGFLRGALRALARERKRAGGAPSVAFRLYLRSDGRLVLEDPVSKQRVDLDSFGAANREAFARLLTAQVADRGAERR